LIKELQMMKERMKVLEKMVGELEHTSNLPERCAFG